MNDKPETNIGYVSPLKKICMTIGQLPTAYLETMSYYEMLVWFVEFLKNQVIPVVNNNSAATKELQDLFVELEDYVNNYLTEENLQPLIDNKLEEMVESGEFEQIVEQFINSSAVWGFDTVNDMKLATNLINGSFAKTSGYYNVNDGGNGFYKIRTKTQEDITNNGDLILLNNNLVAELIIFSDIITVKQFGAKGDGITDDTQLIQNALKYNENNKKKIVFNDSNSYLITGSISIYSNTEIDFNNQHIIIGSEEVLILNNDINGECQYIENIILKNGYFDGTTESIERYCNTLKFGFLRVNNLLVENNTFYKISNDRHTFDLGACTNVIIKNNYWHNVYITSGNRQAELIQIDVGTYNALPYWNENSLLYNNICCSNIEIINNKFKQDDMNNGLINAIGTHSLIPTKFHENIHISNNIFDEPNYGNIKFLCWKDVIIENNIFKNERVQTLEDSSGRANIICTFGTYAENEELRYAPSKNIIISNNIFESLNTNEYLQGIRVTGRENCYHSNIIIENNIFKGSYDNNNDGANFVTLNYTNDSKIINNNISKAKNGFYGVESKNILISNNVVKDCRTYDNITSGSTDIYFDKNLFINNNDIIDLKSNSFIINLSNENFITLSSGVTLAQTFGDIISKEGSLVNINTLLNVTIPSDNTFHTIMNLKAPFRPSIRKSFICFGALNNGYNLKYPCSCMIESGGDVKIRNDSGTDISLLNINGNYIL